MNGFDDLPGMNGSNIIGLFKILWTTELIGDGASANEINLLPLSTFNTFLDEEVINFGVFTVSLLDTPL